MERRLCTFLSRNAVVVVDDVVVDVVVAIFVT